LTEKSFTEGIFSFLSNGVKPRTDYNTATDGELPDSKRLPWDFLAMPQLIVENLSHYPKLFKMIHPDSYFAADQDLHLQLAASVSLILNRRLGSPHLRIEFVNFLLHLVPQKNPQKG